MSDFGVSPVSFNSSDINRLKSILPRTVGLPEKRSRDKLKQVCNNRFNWSDGGHWIGPGKEPGCNQRSYLSATSKVIYTFPTDDSAFRWNSEWEKAIARTGHIATAAITAIVAIKTGGMMAIGVGVLSSILKDEIQLRIQYPKVARGWAYEVSFSHAYKWSAHPFGKSGFYQEVSGKLYDHEAVPKFSSYKRLKFNLSEFPESLAIELASMPPRNQQIVYGGN